MRPSGNGRQHRQHGQRGGEGARLPHPSATHDQQSQHGHDHGGSGGRRCERDRADAGRGRDQLQGGHGDTRERPAHDTPDRGHFQDQQSGQRQRGIGTDPSGQGQHGGHHEPQSEVDDHGPQEDTRLRRQCPHQGGPAQPHRDQHRQIQPFTELRHVRVVLQHDDLDRAEQNRTQRGLQEYGRGTPDADEHRDEEDRRCHDGKQMRRRPQHGIAAERGVPAGVGDRGHHRRQAGDHRQHHARHATHRSHGSCAPQHTQHPPAQCCADDGYRAVQQKVGRNQRVVPAHHCVPRVVPVRGQDTTDRSRHNDPGLRGTEPMLIHHHPPLRASGHRPYPYPVCPQALAHPYPP